MKKIVFLIGVLVCSLLAQSKPICNENNSDGSAGMPLTSCYLKSLSYSIGMDRGYFFIDTGYDVNYKGHIYRLRLGVTSSSDYYNDFQAIVQTAYATRSTITIIYPNSDVTSVGNGNYGLTDSECRVNTDNKGKPANMYCPIQSITLSN